LVIADEDARRLEQNLSALGDLHIDVDIRLAHGVGIDFAVGLRRDVDRGFGLPVELLQVDAKRAIEAEDLGTDRLARRVADADARKAESVLERAINQDLAQPIEQARRERHASLVEDLLAPL